jgi:RIP metalloprotease RseP
MNAFSFFSSILQIPIYFFWFVVVMIPLVVAHEFGHFLIARAFKVKVPEFGVGVPPRVTGKRWKGVLWSLNWIPLGAFVRIVGDNDAVENTFHKRQLAIETKTGFELEENLLDIRQDYIDNRYEEVLALSDTQVLVENNGSEYDKSWVAFEKIAKKNRNNTNDSNVSVVSNLDMAKVRELKTFISWEYDGYFGKDKAGNKKEKSKEKLQKGNISELFFTKNLLQKILILIGGVTANIIMAFFLFLIALNTTGLVATNPFEKAGLIDYKYLVTDKAEVDAKYTKSSVGFQDRGVVFVNSDKFKDDKDFEPFRSQVSSNPFIKGEGVFKKILKLERVENIAVAQTSNPQVSEEGEIIEGLTVQKSDSLSAEKRRDLQISGIDNKWYENYFKDTQNASSKYFITIVDVEKGVEISKPKTLEAKGEFLASSILVNRVTYKSLNFISSIGDAVVHTGYYTQITTTGTFEFFQKLFSKDSKEAASQVSGPIGISHVSSLFFNRDGLPSILFLMALISISLAIMNMLPIPALDGGRILLVILYRIFGEKVKKIEPYLVSFTYIILLVIMFAIMFKDVYQISTNTFGR